MPLGQPIQTVPGPTATPREVRTRFCTATGWHRYDDVTPAMRRVIFAAHGGVGLVPCPPSKRTEDRLIAMGLVERDGGLYRLTWHGELLWVELAGVSPPPASTDGEQ